MVPLSRRNALHSSVSISRRRKLEWDFGAIRRDVVVTAKTLQPASAWTKNKGCKVKAEKLNSTNGQTWKITHFESVV